MTDLPELRSRWRPRSVFRYGARDVLDPAVVVTVTSVQDDIVLVSAPELSVPASFDVERFHRDFEPA